MKILAILTMSLSNMFLNAMAVKLLNFKRGDFRANQLRLLNTTEAPNLMDCADHCDIYTSDNIAELEVEHARCYGITYDKATKECLLKNFEPWVMPTGDLEQVWYKRSLLRK